MNRLLAWLTLSIVVSCGSCSSLPTPAQRRQSADLLAESRQWQASVLQAGTFQLMSYLPTKPAPTRSLTIYIEGDGLAWISGSRASRDPTPSDPLALRLALAQPDGAAAYLGRPCQYIDAGAASCNSRYWTEARFSSDVIAATDRAVGLLKDRFGAPTLTLVGYSGGGAVAALVAGRRHDVERLVTIGGNLNPAAWADLHHLTPLADSQNPAHQVEALHGVAQWHLVGERDRNITPALVWSFAALFPANERPHVLVIPGFDHRCCWAERWPSLWKSIDAAGR